jgi:hypothetical protein
VQDGGVVWRHGGVDGRPGKVNALISLGDGFAEDGGGDSTAYAMVCATRRIVFLTYQWAVWEDTHVLDDVRSLFF